MIPTKLQREEINFVLIEKSGKKPFQKDWQNKKIKFNDVELTDHLSNGGNYGVIGGGEKNLVIVDFDDEKIQEEVTKKLPETFTVKTGSGLLHKYFFSDACDSFKIFNKELDTLADVQGTGKQVVGAGSIHPNGNKYELVEDKDINYIDYKELRAILEPYNKKKKKEKPLPTSKVYGEDIVEEVKNSVALEDVLSEFGVDTSKNPSNCPFHFSKGGKCLGWNNETAHCFHCDDSWNVFSWVMESRKCNFKEALEYLASKGNMSNKLEESRKEWAKKNKAAKIFQREGQAEQFMKDLPYFYDLSGMFWLWDSNKKFWEIHDDVNMLNFIRGSTGQDVISSKSRTEILNSLKQNGRENIPKDIKPTWIQFQDKIYDVVSGESFEATPDYFVTNPIPYNVSGDPRTPIMDKIFKEWVGEKYVQTLYEILAYSLLPSYPVHRIFCLIGSGMNGKSCFLSLLRKFIGGQNVCSTELDTLLNSRFEVTRLHKKLICQMGETNFNEMSKTSMLKKLSGGDLIGFEYKNKTPFESVNYAKIIIATNNLPTTTDKTIGFYRRWLILDFPNRFSEKKDILLDIPEDEYNNLATKCVINLKSLLDKREFKNEGSVEERMKRYEAKSDFLRTFIDKFTKEDPDGYITKADFYKKFISWCKEERHRHMSETSVSLSVKKMGIDSSTKHFDWLYDGKGGNARIWLGISWLE